jgi:hypothetical protein
MRINGNFLFLDRVEIMDSLISNLQSPYHKMILSFQVQISVDSFFIPNECLDEVKKIILNISEDCLNPISLEKGVSSNLFRLKDQEHLGVRW